MGYGYFFLGGLHCYLLSTYITPLFMVSRINFVGDSFNIFTFTTFFGPVFKDNLGTSILFIFCINTSSVSEIIVSYIIDRQLHPLAFGNDKQFARVVLLGLKFPLNLRGWKLIFLGLGIRRGCSPAGTHGLRLWIRYMTF